MKIYISGPITGMEKYMERFERCGKDAVCSRAYRNKSCKSKCCSFQKIQAMQNI